MIDPSQAVAHEESTNHSNVIILTINSGSTSVKLGAFATASDDASVPAVREIVREKRSGHALDAHELLKAFTANASLTQIDVVAHRVVHGGTRFNRPVRIDDGVLRALEGLSPLAPLHNPVALHWIKCAREVCDKAVHIAAFDTAFFAQLPRAAAEYALPASLGTEQGVRRYGFHGLAHEAMWRRWRDLHPSLTANGRIISLQLGGGCSLAAVRGGRPIDTSMGFSPLEGLVMATRTGDIDAAVVPYLAEKLQCTAADIITRFNREAGLKGLSGRSENINDLLADESEGAQFAVELYCYRARKYIGAYLAALGGCDGIVFGGGVGEHVPQVRKRMLENMQWAGIELDPALNAQATGAEATISSARSSIDVVVIPVDEERVLAEAACLTN
jgi:acetate kinase